MRCAGHRKLVHVSIYDTVQAANEVHRKLVAVTNLVTAPSLVSAGHLGNPGLERCRHSQRHWCSDFLSGCSTVCSSLRQCTVYCSTLTCTAVLAYRAIENHSKLIIVRGDDSHFEHFSDNFDGDIKPGVILKVLQSRQQS